MCIRDRAIQQAYKRDRAAILDNKGLSDLGKRQKIEALEAQRQGQVQALQAEAEGVITRTRGAVELKLKLEGEKHLDARRKLLGDSVLADIYRREIELLEPADIATAYQAAPTEWEKEVIAGYGLPLLQMRARTNPNGEVLNALGVLNQAEPEPLRNATAELRDLDYAAKRLDELDREGYNTALADKMGLNVAYLE